MNALSQASLLAAFLAAVSASIAGALLPGLIRILTAGGLTRPNFTGRAIPTGTGILLPLAALTPLALASIAVGRDVAGTWISLLLGMGLIGFFDDAAGDRSARGFRGHLMALWRGEPTTGSFKALFGGALALYAGWSLYGAWTSALVAGGLIALCTNAVNLLDVRPGRALKGYLVLSGIGLIGSLMAIHPTSALLAHLSLAGAPFGAALALWAPDHRGRIMLGDAGANVLGAAAGLLLAGATLPFQLTALLILLLLHILTERISLTRIIESIPLLDGLDRLGRPAEEGAERGRNRLGE